MLKNNQQFAISPSFWPWLKSYSLPTE